MKKIINIEFVHGICSYLTNSPCPSNEVQNIIKGLQALPEFVEAKPQEPTATPQSTPPVDTAPVTP